MLTYSFQQIQFCSGILIIGYFLDKFVSSEGKSLKGLPGLILRFYQYWVRVYTKGRHKRSKFGSDKSLESTAEANKEERLPKEKAPFLRESGPRMIVRRGYYQVVQRGRRSGLNWQASQTPEETAVELTKLLPTEEESIKEITVDYQQARYGHKELEKDLVRLFLQRVRTIMSRLRTFLS